MVQMDNEEIGNLAKPRQLTRGGKPLGHHLRCYTFHKGNKHL